MGRKLSRRQFISTTAATTAAINLAAPAVAAGSPNSAVNLRPGIWVRWLDDRAAPVSQGATWGTPWPRGKLKSTRDLSLRDAAGKLTALQSWALGYWPDGSLKWTGHALAPDAPDAPAGNGPFEVVAARAPKAKSMLVVRETADGIEIDTGAIVCKLPRRGAAVISSIHRDRREHLRDGRLVLLRDDRGSSSEGTFATDRFESAIDKVTLEHSGDARAVVKVEGKHAGAARTWLPFTLRFYFYAGSDALRVLHTIVFDGDENKDFIRGIGLRFSTPLSDPLHDRHVRFAGDRRWCVRRIGARTHGSAARCRQGGARRAGRGPRRPARSRRSSTT